MFDRTKRACVLLSGASMLLMSCREQTPSRPQNTTTEHSVVRDFQFTLKAQGEMVFMDSSKLGAAVDGTILELRFSKDSRLFARTFGNGFSDYYGTYSFSGGNEIEIQLENQVWPELVLSKDGDGFLINRKDGLRSLTNHIIFKLDDGTQLRVDDGDIYQEAKFKIFPFSERKIGL